MELSITSVTYQVLGKDGPINTSVSGALNEMIRRHSDLIEGKKIRRSLLNAFIKRNNSPFLPFKADKILENQGYIISDKDPIPYTKTFRRINEGSKVRIVDPEDDEFNGKMGKVTSIKVERRILPLIEVTFSIDGKKVTEEFREYHLETMGA